MTEKNHYNTLNVPRDATQDIIKRSFQQLAKKYHPDKVNYLGEDFQQAAKEKFQKVNEAYEDIKKQRDMA